MFRKVPDFNNIYNLDFKRTQTSRVIIIGFLSLIFIGTMLLSLPVASRSDQSIGLIDAIFTATSAVCVTGLVVVDTAAHWSLFGQGVILLLIQIGGLGFMTLGTMIVFILGQKLSLKERIVKLDSFDDVTLSVMIKLSSYVILMTFIIESLGALILSIKFIPMYGFKKGLWMSIFHSVSAFCNAGFDLFGDFRSLTPFVKDPLITMTIAVLIILGGLGFVVILEVIQKRHLSKLSLHGKLVVTMTVFLLLAGLGLFYLFEFNNGSTFSDLSQLEKLYNSFFYSVTTRTAGFHTVMVDHLTLGSVFLTIVLMFVGGASGSTAGGVKITTIGVIFIAMKSFILGKKDAEVFRRRISREIVNKSLAIVSLSIILVVIMTMLLSVTEVGHSFVAIYFETISAFGTVGLSMGITPSLSGFGRIIISILMFIGRVGPLTVFIGLSRQGRSKEDNSYPEEKTIVG